MMCSYFNGTNEKLAKSPYSMAFLWQRQKEKLLLQIDARKTIPEGSILMGTSLRALA